MFYLDLEMDNVKQKLLCRRKSGLARVWLPRALSDSYLVPASGSIFSADFWSPNIGNCSRTSARARGFVTLDG
jgi:hypothetical protein